MEHIINIIQGLLKPTSVIIVFILLFILNSWIFKKGSSIQSNKKIVQQTITIFLILIAILAFVLTLPIEKSLKGNILSLLGIVLSAGIALSSTTILGNLIAGLMNNTMHRLKHGTLVKINDWQGRVTKKGIFYMEIQLDDSNFINIPNLFIAANPIKLMRNDNTIAIARVSLGYDISRITIEKALKEAVILAGLKDPYIYIESLGDFSVVYKVHGFMEDNTDYFSKHSLLRASIMDKLHEYNIEIVSPSFMNQRKVDDQQFIPSKRIPKQKVQTAETPESKVFDEAYESMKIESIRDKLKDLKITESDIKEEIKNANDETKEQLKTSLAKNKKQQERIEQYILKLLEEQKNEKL